MWLAAALDVPLLMSVNLIVFEKVTAACNSALVQCCDIDVHNQLLDNQLKVLNFWPLPYKVHEMQPDSATVDLGCFPLPLLLQLLP